MSQPRLLSINNYYYPRGGAEAVFFEQNRLLEEAGWEVVPFAMRHPRNQPSPWDRYFVDEIEFGHAYGLLDKVRMAGKVVYSREAQRKIGELIDAVRPTLAHAHNIYHHISPAILPRLRQAGVPTVLTLHDLKIACPAYTMRTDGEVCERCKGGGLHNVVLNRCIKGSVALSSVVWAEAAVNKLLGSYSANVDRFIVPSRFYMRKLVEWGWPAERFAHLPNFVKAEVFEPAREAGKGLVYFGRLAHEKGIDVAIRAAAFARVPLTLVGTGQEETRLRRLAADMGADVTFAGYKSGAELHDIIRAHRGTVLASTWYENAPMSVLEAYALGKPVLGADIGGIPELVRSGETGALSPAGHVTRLAERMRWLTDLPDARVLEMGRAGRAWVEREFTPAAHRERLLEIYDGVRQRTSAAAIRPTLPMQAPVAEVTATPSRPSVIMLGLRGCPQVQGGVEKHVEQLGPHLTELGWNVEVLARRTYIDPDAPRQWRGMRIRPLWSPGGRHSEAIVHTFLGVLYAAFRHPSILHIHAVGPSLLVPLARMLGLKVVVTHHGYDYERQKWGTLARLALRLGEHAGMRLSHGRITVSEGIASQMRSRYGVTASAIPNGVEFVAPSDDDAGALARFGLQPGRYVLSVGRLVEEKRHLDLVHAFRRAKLEGWKLAIVGAADHPDDYSARLQEAVRDDARIVMTSFQSGAALASLYAHAGMFVLPSSHEGLPIALLEAMSVGLPCIASDIAANREVGLPSGYFAVGDIDALTRQLERVSARPHSEVEAARLKLLVRETYDWQRSAERTVAVYRQALSGGIGSGGENLCRARAAGA